MKLHVGNLSYDTTDSELQAAFAAHGSVGSAQVITDRDTGRTRGFGFVEMASQAEAQAAMSALNGSQLQGRTIAVSESKPRTDRGSAGNRGGYSSERSRW